MPKIAYIKKRFGKVAQSIIANANRIIVTYQEVGQKLTLRQLYYRFIAMDLFPDCWIDEKYNLKNGLAPNTKNTVKNYKKLGDIINDARLAGLIDWEAIEDRTRNLHSTSHWSSPRSIVRACAQQFSVDMWETQDNYVEVWVEKEALVGVLEGVCNEFDVPHFACKGYTSASEMWGAAMRLREREEAGKATTIIHLGDHDPSGIDMSRDIQDRLSLFGASAVVRRIALNWDQIDQYAPPPNPAKATDSRFKVYQELYGDDSWELDALEPNVISELIKGEIEYLIDLDEWNAQAEKQAQGREQLKLVANRWDDTVEFLENGDV